VNSHVASTYEAPVLWIGSLDFDYLVMKRFGCESQGRFDVIEMSTTGELLDGRYRLGTLLGRGGMSDVFRAVDEVNSTDVAIKIVRSPDREYAQRLSQEAQALRRFSHPGLVQLFESGSTATWPIS